MSFWDDIEDVASSAVSAVKKGAEAVAGVIEDVANAVGQAVGGAVETIGHGAAKVIKRLGRAIRKVPLIGPALDRLATWAGDVISSATHFVGSAIKGALGAIGGAAAGLIRVVGGLFTGDRKLLVKGLGGIVFGIGGGVVVAFGSLVGLVQAVLFLQGPRELPSREEHEMLWRIFRRSISFENVRIVRGWAGLLSLINPKPVTIGNTIYLKSTPPDESMKQLVHECGHVWQFQNRGASYSAEALGAQWTIDEAYDWRAEAIAGKQNWQELNAEAQAELFEDVYMDGRRTDLPSPGARGDFYFDDPIGTKVLFIAHTMDFTGLARESTAFVRSVVN